MSTVVHPSSSGAASSAQAAAASSNSTAAAASSASGAFADTVYQYDEEAIAKMRKERPWDSKSASTGTRELSALTEGLQVARRDF
jgi:hypothetical protein